MTSPAKGSIAVRIAAVAVGSIVGACSLVTRRAACTRALVRASPIAVSSDPLASSGAISAQLTAR